MSLELLNKRLEYQGGNQEQRMINDKLRGLKRALLYSYQAATAVLADEREFRCLINPDKNKPAYDNKIISIPYKDICLNKPRAGKRSEGEEEIGMKCGDVFTWKQTNSHWLVYLEALEEDAYFRSEIRRCDQQVDVDGTKYWVYLRGPVETEIEWNDKKRYEWNDLNYSQVMYITADQNTNNYFARFKTIKIVDPRYGTEKTWQVSCVDPYYGDGILQVMLSEFYNNTIADQAEKEKPVPPQPPKEDPYISGPIEVPQYSKAYYQIKNTEDQGQWYVIWKEEEIDLEYNKKILPLEIPTGDLGTFTLIYRRQDKEDITLEVKIIPF